MADPVSADTVSDTPRELPSASATLPTTPTSIVSSSNLPIATESESLNHLKTASFADPNQIPFPPHLSSIANAGLNAYSAPRSPKLGLAQGYAPQPLTGVAAMADERKMRDESERLLARQQSPNPVRAALSALIAGAGDKSMSRPQDAPTASNSVNEPLAAAAKTLKLPTVTQSDSNAQTSPVSMSSFGTLDSATVPIASADTPTVVSPGSMGEPYGVEDGAVRENNASADAGPTEDARTAKALTFPGPLSGVHLANDARRGMSLPHAGLGQSSPRSLTAKKHKCPYCATDFTRHHNLKSHLLTHSHEKPYVCQTCQARFRRLHDLKRHTKLHTGERPHICPKCGRRFARGDALARHNKGQGGCAGRRASLGSYGGDDDFGEESQGGPGREDSMDGLMYTGEASQDVDQMDEDGDLAEDGRPRSLPSIKKHDAPAEPPQSQAASSQNLYNPRPPSTYPPVAARQPTGGLYPPNVTHGGGQSSGSPTTSTHAFERPPGGGSGSSAFQIGGQSIFSQGGMTESPKPLSPGAASAHQLGHSDSGIHHNRSPSLTQQFQQHQYGRRTSARSPPPMGLPPPMSSGSQSNAPHLPSLPGLTPPDPRFTLHSQTSGPAQLRQGVNQGGQPVKHISGGGGSSSSFHSQASTGHAPAPSTGDSYAGRVQSNHAQGSGELSSNLFAAGNDPLWAYVRGLEERINRLQDEVNSLKGQLAAAQNR